MGDGAFTSIIRSHGAFVAIALAWFLLMPPTLAFSGTVSYSYDDLGRLLQETYDDGTRITYTYDGTGNRLTKEVHVGSGFAAISPDTGEMAVGGTNGTLHQAYSGNPGAGDETELPRGGT